MPLEAPPRRGEQAQVLEAPAPEDNRPRLELVIHIHVLETRMQAVSGRRMYGKTLVEHMDAIGFLSPRVVFASLKLASLVHKLWGIDYEQWLGAKEAWQLATIGGAQAAGDASGLGRIEPGRRADLVLLDLDSHVFTPLNDPLRQLALGSSTLAVRSVLVGGEWSVRDGRAARVDEADVLARARATGAEVVGRFDEAFELGQQLLASLREGWLEALATDVGVERKLTL
jgi:cytosine/adenosine deaminase-related metal-dependent hydrolase